MLRRAVPNTNSHSRGWTERVMMSRWSWRSLRISAWAMAIVPAAMRARGPEASAGGRRSAEAAGDAALCADIGEPPFVLVAHGGDVPAGDGREDLFEALCPVALEQLRRRALLDQTSLIDDGESLAVALRLLHQVGGDEDRRPGLLAQGLKASPDHAARARIEADGGLVEEQHRGAIEQRGRDLQAPQHAPGEGAGEPVEHRGEIHRLDRLRDALAALAPRHARDPPVEVEDLVCRHLVVDGDRLGDVVDARPQRP